MKKTLMGFAIIPRNTTKINLSYSLNKGVWRATFDVALAHIELTTFYFPNYIKMQNPYK